MGCGVSTPSITNTNIPQRRTNSGMSITIRPMNGHEPEKVAMMNTFSQKNTNEERNSNGVQVGKALMEVSIAEDKASRKNVSISKVDINGDKKPSGTSSKVEDSTKNKIIDPKQSSLSTQKSIPFRASTAHPESAKTKPIITEEPVVPKLKIPEIENVVVDGSNVYPASKAQLPFRKNSKGPVLVDNSYSLDPTNNGHRSVQNLKQPEYSIQILSPVVTAETSSSDLRQNMHSYYKMPQPRYLPSNPQTSRDHPSALKLDTPSKALFHAAFTSRLIPPGQKIIKKQRCTPLMDISKGLLGLRKKIVGSQAMLFKVGAYMNHSRNASDSTLLQELESRAGSAQKMANVSKVDSKYLPPLKKASAITALSTLLQKDEFTEASYKQSKVEAASPRNITGTPNGSSTYRAYSVQAPQKKILSAVVCAVVATSKPKKKAMKVSAVNN